MPDLKIRRLFSHVCDCRNRDRLRWLCRTYRHSRKACLAGCLPARSGLAMDNASAIGLPDCSVAPHVAGCVLEPSPRIRGAATMRAGAQPRRTVRSREEKARRKKPEGRSREELASGAVGPSHGRPIESRRKKADPRIARRRCEDRPDAVLRRRDIAFANYESAIAINRRRGSRGAPDRAASPRA